MSNINNSINYIEFPMTRKDETKAFYSQVFRWEFTDWGEDYISFSGASVDGGFDATAGVSVNKPGVLVVLYAKDLNKKLEEIKIAGGEIVKPIYEFPGGKRFHFRDPNGNELAVWSQ